MATALRRALDRKLEELVDQGDQTIAIFGHAKAVAGVQGLAVAVQVAVLRVVLADHDVDHMLGVQLHAFEVIGLRRFIQQAAVGGEDRRLLAEAGAEAQAVGSGGRHCRLA